MDPDLGGMSSPVRVKAITVGDGNYERRTGTSPWTEHKPSQEDTHKEWVRLRIMRDGRVRYEQVDHEGKYYVVDFPVNAPWQGSDGSGDEHQQAEHMEFTETEHDAARHEETGEACDAERREDPEEKECNDAAAGPCAGTMEYRNFFGDTKARISYEYRPRALTRSRRSKLRISADLTGRHFTLIREERRQQSSRRGSGNRQQATGDDDTAERPNR
ncbi:MAG: hypothetical protein SGILL_008915 [Bacillariaceae sp.]